MRLKNPSKIANVSVPPPPILLNIICDTGSINMQILADKANHFTDCPMLVIMT